jgi:hypothetical protein
VHACNKVDNRISLCARCWVLPVMVLAQRRNLEDDNLCRWCMSMHLYQTREAASRVCSKYFNLISCVWSSLGHMFGEAWSRNERKINFLKPFFFGLLSCHVCTWNEFSLCVHASRRHIESLQCKFQIQMMRTICRRKSPGFSQWQNGKTSQPIIGIRIWWLTGSSLESKAEQRKLEGDFINADEK